MKDLQSLVHHPSVQGAGMIVLNSGKPVVLVRGHDRAGLGQPLSNQHIMGLLKASLPKEVTGGFQWGKSLKHELLAGDERFVIEIQLKADKTFHVQIDLTPIDTPSVDTLEPGEAVKDAPQLDEDTMEDLVAQLTRGDRLALIYAVDFQQAAVIEKAVTESGYQARKTNEAAPVLEVLKYHDYPVFVMALDEHYRRDPVYAALTGMNMDLRRTQFSILVAPGLKTGDTMQAFSLSVHLCVAPDDLDHLRDYMERGMTTWQRTTGPFHEFLEAEGRL
ncbi:MAG: hypothetical protein QNK37_01275 [Acidobacteriota bacterium]|nr:hypothetical protein [Acidobacteriota bacterium]